NGARGGVRPCRDEPVAYAYDAAVRGPAGVNRQGPPESERRTAGLTDERRRRSSVQPGTICSAWARASSSVGSGSRTSTSEPSTAPAARAAVPADTTSTRAPDGTSSGQEATTTTAPAAHAASDQ